MTGARRRAVRLARVSLAGLLVVLAFLVAVAGVFVHRWSIPLGLLLALGAVVGTCILTREVSRTRLALAVAALAWLAPVLVFAQRRPSGDVLVANDPVGLVFLFGGAVSWAVTLGLGAKRLFDHQG